MQFHRIRRSIRVSRPLLPITVTVVPVIADYLVENNAEEARYGERCALEIFIARRTDSTRDWMRDVDASLQDDFGPMIKRHDRLDARHFFNINLCHPLSAICRMSNPRGRRFTPSLPSSLPPSLPLFPSRRREPRATVIMFAEAINIRRHLSPFFRRKVLYQRRLRVEAVSASVTPPLNAENDSRTRARARAVISHD